MQNFKRISLTFLVVILFVVIISFFLPANVVVKRCIIIDASPDSVFVQINNLKNWERWSPWYDKKGNMTLTYNGIPSGPDAMFKWQSDSPDIENGSIKITASSAPDSICTDMNFMEWSKARGVHSIKRTPEGTEVCWTLQVNMGLNPVMRYLGVMMDKMVGNDFEKGLKNLKQVCEKH